MEDSTSKWIRFGFGVSPTLFFILVAIIERKASAGPPIFLGSIVYLVIGFIMASRMENKDADRRAFTAGIISGFAASFILSATLCFSSIG